MYSQNDFFRTVLSGEGKPCLGWLTKNKKFAHKTFDSVDELCDALVETNYGSADYYFCISTLRDHSIEVPNRSGVKKRVRVQRNALRTRVFVLDVDIRPDKDGFYSTYDEAEDGVAHICESLSLPDPIIVNSGYGLHVYWPMADGVMSDKWRKTAQKFKKAIGLIAPEVVADGSRVSDSAGVLRVPLSFNHKDDPARPVEIIQWFSSFLDFGEFDKTLTRSTGLKGEAPVADINVDLNIQRGDIEPVDIKDVAKGCNWTKEYLKNRATASEPEWYAMLGLVPYLYIRQNENDVTGPRLANIVSKGHSGFSESATEDKYHQTFDAQTGPTTCERLESLAPSRCKGCPFFKAVKTPIQTASLDKPITKEETVEATTKTESGNRVQETITIPIPPKPYFRGESGGVYVRRKVKDDDTGDWDVEISKVYDYDMYPMRRIRNESSESESMEVHLWLPMDGLRKFKLSNGLLADNKSLNKFLSEKGVVSEHGTGKGITKYLVDYVRHLQMNRAAEIEFSRFGWRDMSSTEPKFVVGNGYYDKRKEFHQSAISDYLRDASQALTDKGSIEEWKKGFSMYEGIPKSDAYIFTAMLGFAAPLIALTEYSGVLYNMVGNSAAGKSTALKAMSSVWGKPNPQHTLITDTDISIYNFIGYLSNVPVAFDEVTKMDDNRVSDFVLNFTGGRGKMRATKSGQNRDNNVHWDTIVASTSNTSLYNKVVNARRGYNAEAMRIFEVNVDASEPQYKSQIDGGIYLLRENYGIAGREFIKYILPRLPAVKKQVEKAVELLTTKNGLRTEERFWGALLACVFVGGQISRKALGLHNYDMNSLMNWATDKSESVREVVESVQTGPVSTLAEFINSNLDAILRIQDGNVDLSSMSGSMRKIVARLEYLETDRSYGFFSVSAIRNYCKHNSIDSAWLHRELKEEGIIVGGGLQKRLTAGTKLPIVNTRCWKVDLQHPKLADKLD